MNYKIIWFVIGLIAMNGALVHVINFNLWETALFSLGDSIVLTGFFLAILEIADKPVIRITYNSVTEKASISTE